MSDSTARLAPQTTPFTCREGEGVNLGGERVVVVEIGDGIVTLRATAPLPTQHRARFGETLWIAGAKVLVEKLAEDGRRRVVLRVTAPYDLNVSKFQRRPEAMNSQSPTEMIGSMAWPL